MNLARSIVLSKDMEQIMGTIERLILAFQKVCPNTRKKIRKLLPALASESSTVRDNAAAAIVYELTYLDGSMVRCALCDSALIMGSCPSESCP